MELRQRQKRKRLQGGVIPDDWGEDLLDHLAKRGSGHTPDKKHPEYWNGKIKWISLADSPKLDRVYISDTFAKVTSAGIANSSAVVHPPGTVVLSRDAGVGKSAIMTTEMAVSQHFIAWCCGPQLDNRYLYYWLQSAKPIFEQIADGSTIKTIGLAFFRALTIPKPTIEEQRAIATALSDVDALLDGLDRLIAKKRDIKQAAMQQLLTGKTRLPGFEGEWGVKTLGDLARIQRGASPRPIDSPIWFDSTSSVGWVRISDVTSSGMHLEDTVQRLSPLGVRQSRPVPSGSLIMSICATVGRPIITRIDVCIHDGFVVFDGLNADQIFTYYLLKWIEPGWSQHGQTGSQMNLNTGLINGTEVNLPPLDEQSAIGALLLDMDSEIDALEKRRTKTRDLKQAMMQELLTGRTRLI